MQSSRSAAGHSIEEDWPRKRAAGLCSAADSDPSFNVRIADGLEFGTVDGMLTIALYLPWQAVREQPRNEAGQAISN